MFIPIFGQFEFVEKNDLLVYVLVLESDPFFRALVIILCFRHSFNIA